MSNGRLVTKPFKSTSTKEKETPNDIINRNKVDENETSNMNTNSATELTKDDINELSASILDEVLEDWDDKDALAGVNPNGLIRADTEPVSSSTPVPKLAGTLLCFTCHCAIIFYLVIYLILQEKTLMAVS